MYPEGIVEDVLVKVHDLIFPADFYVLNMDNTHDRKQLMVLGRPFLKTARTLIDCNIGKLTCQFVGETVTFDIYKAEQYPPELEMVDFVDSTEQLVEKVLPEIVVKDGYARVIHGFQPALIEFDKEAAEAEKALETEIDEPGSMQSLLREVELMLPSLVKAPELELKRLPKHFKYIYLGKDDTLHVIISAELTIRNEEETRELLSKYKASIGWSLADIKGISPTVCQHQILLEADALLVHDPQRKLNPVMKEVVKKEILKLLKMEIIYPVWIAVG